MCMYLCVCFGVGVCLGVCIQVCICVHACMQCFARSSAVSESGAPVHLLLRMNVQMLVATLADERADTRAYLQASSQTRTPTCAHRRAAEGTYSRMQTRPHKRMRTNMRARRRTLGGNAHKRMHGRPLGHSRDVVAMHTHMHPCAHVLPAHMHVYARASAYVDRRSRACSLLLEHRIKPRPPPRKRARQQLPMAADARRHVSMPARKQMPMAAGAFLCTRIAHASKTMRTCV